MSTVLGILRLTRPSNSVICFVSVVCGGILNGRPLDRLGDIAEFLFFSHTGDSLWMVLLFAGAISATLILAAGNAFNDVCDIRCDTINAPHRPIPSGMVTMKSAVVMSAVLAAAGLVASLPLGVEGCAVALTAVVLLAMYDVKLKSVPLAGNIAVAVLGGMAFVYGGIAGDTVERSLLPALFAFLFHFGRELVKDAADVRGDSAAGVATTATRWGVRTASIIASAVFVVLAIGVIAPYACGYFGNVYLTITAIGVLPVLLYASLLPLGDMTERTLRRTALVLKLDMPLGIAAVLAGFQGW